MATSRQFTHSTAVRTRVPLIIGIAGPSSTGKTKSALRLADGMARLDKRPTFFVDTESRRSLHYANEHRFEYVPFAPPHSPMDYFDIISYCVDRGAGRVVVDSMSHEHDGEGGVIQMHKAELERLGNNMKRSFEAWHPAKAARRRLINRMMNSGIDLILCFRADEKRQPVPGKAPIELGWTAIAGREFKYEMVVKFLLLPGARGVPTWRSDFAGERDSIKIPGQFDALFSRSAQLSEDIGDAMARWAGGGDAPTASIGPRSIAELLTCLGACNDRETLDQLDEEGKLVYGALTPADQKRLNAAARSAHQRVKMLEAQAANAARAMAEAAASPTDEEEEPETLTLAPDGAAPPPAEPSH